MILLTEILNLLEARADGLRLDGGLGFAFAAWLDEKRFSSEMIDVVRDRCVTLSGAQRRYSDVATLGFLQALRPADASVLDRLEDGLKWMAGRSIRSEGQSADFCDDVLALLGLSVGVRRASVVPSIREWLQKAIGANPVRQSAWDTSIRTLAKMVAGFDCSYEDLVVQVKVVAFAKGLGHVTLTVEDTEGVIAGLKVSEVSKMSDGEAAVLLCAFDFLERSQPLLALQAPTISSVASVLSNLTAGLSRWTWESKGKTAGSEPRRWHLDNEYHFQNMLWFTLRPLFPDAKEEEYKSAVGKVHPRLDIVLPSLRLIVEAKFWRRRDSSKEIVREIAEDSGLYLTVNKPYDAIVPVIWDDGRRVEEHDSLKLALTEIEGVTNPVIVPRPGFME